MNAFRFLIKCKFTNTLIFPFRVCSNQAVLHPQPSSDATEPKISTLFVPGRKGGEVYQIVKPVVDTNYLKDNLGCLKLSCDHRGIELDLDYTLRLADKWINIKNNHSALCQKHEEYIEEIKRLQSINEKEKVNDLTKEKNEIITKLVSVKNEMYDHEDILMPLFQKIPHFLHPSTPLQFSIIEASKEPEIKNVDSKSHVEIAKSMIIFPTNSSMSYFLNGKLAILEFAIQSFFLEKMCGEEFIPLSCADFCKSFIVEAVGSIPHSYHDCIFVKEKKSSSIGQKLHLVGGASLESMCAYLTNMNIAKTHLPLRYFSVGKQYNATNANNKLLNLFSVVQSVNVHNMIVSDNSLENDFDYLVKLILSCYSDLDLPFRTIKVSAKNLKITESRRIDIELWAPSIKDYIPVAYISQHDDFISKRLSITYGEDYKKEGYCNIIEGTLCNLPVIIGCIVENFYMDENDFKIPDVIEKYMV